MRRFCPGRPGASHRPFAALPGLLLLLAACAAAPDFALGDTRVRDAKPALGIGSASRQPIQGIDVSRFQGDIDWNAVRRAGITFAYIKTTEGGDYADPKFMHNWTAAAAAGLRRGAYHLMSWCRTSDQQALFFILNVPADPAALPPVLDLEWNDTSQSCPTQVSPAEARAMIRNLLGAMEAHTGKRPIIYTNTNFYRDVLGSGGLSNYQFWLRSVTTPPQQAYPGRPFAFWQYTSTGRVPGIAGDVDRNVFNGSGTAWSHWLNQVGVATAR